VALGWRQQQWAAGSMMRGLESASAGFRPLSDLGLLTGFTRCSGRLGMGCVSGVWRVLLKASCVTQ
jgi:hypothetical protein